MPPKGREMQVHNPMLGEPDMAGLTPSDGDAAALANIHNAMIAEKTRRAQALRQRRRRGEEREGEGRTPSTPRASRPPWRPSTCS